MIIARKLAADGARSGLLLQESLRIQREALTPELIELRRVEAQAVEHQDSPLGVITVSMGVLLLDAQARADVVAADAAAKALEARIAAEQQRISEWKRHYSTGREPDTRFDLPAAGRDHRHRPGQPPGRA